MFFRNIKAFIFKIISQKYEIITRFYQNYKVIIKKLYFELTKKSRRFFKILRRFFQNYESKIRNNKTFHQNYKVIIKKLYFELTKKSRCFFRYIEAFSFKL